ncbi:MAG: hypothetical protein JO336_18840 [Acidobacteriia bacterium]|nr:hypothetical protein [Terriglobia bacterium]MBV9744662.1 hypothetical protein [Terriglobia bacterium]
MSTRSLIPGLLLLPPVFAAFLLSPSLVAQGRGGPPPGPPPTAKAAAPEDLTGYWVSLVTEDWRYRMVTPPKGDYASVPLNPEGRRVADMWDPAKDEAAGLQCKSYGAAALMRVPGRVHITWADDNTLKVETDAGTQTRLFHFGNAQPPSGDAGWQGYSVATWEPAGAGGRGGRGGPPRGGSLKVVTTHMRQGYLRKNGVPYSANAVLTEYYTRTNEDDGTSYLIITTLVEDPQYLQQTFVTSTHFKMEPNGAKWSPSPCTAK